MKGERKTARLRNLAAERRIGAGVGLLPSSRLCIAYTFFSILSNIGGGVSRCVGLSGRSVDEKITSLVSTID